MNLSKNFEEEIRNISKQLVRRYKPEKNILFGSCARGNPTEASDIDLLIIKKTKKNRLDRTKDIYLSTDFNLPFQPLMLTPEEIKSRVEAGDFFLMDVLKEGRIIYEQAKPS